MRPELAKRVALHATQGCSWPYLPHLPVGGGNFDHLGPGYA